MKELLYPILIPAVTGLIVLLVPRRQAAFRHSLSLLAAVLTAFFAALLFSGKGAAFTATWLQVENFTLNVAFRADALSRFIVLAASVFGALIVLYSISYMAGRDRPREYYAYVLWTIAGANAALLADNLLLLLIAWEAVTLLLFLLITIGGDAARPAAGKAFVMIGASDCCLLLGIVLMWRMQHTLTISSFNGVATETGFAIVAYLLLMVGALTKAGAMPFHSWIPAAAGAAPVSVMAFLPAALDKLLGIYLLARITLFMFAPSGGIRLVLLIIGAVTVILAVMAALVQPDLKKMLSYQAVGQVGYILLGIGTGVPVGIAGGLLHMLNHAIYKCCLFLGAGAVEKRTGTTEMDKLGGLAGAMPLAFAGFLIGGFAMSGIPPFNAFASKWLVYQGLLEMGGYGSAVFLIAALFGSALTLAAFVKALYSVFLGQRPPNLAETRPAGFAMAMPIAFLALLCVLFGVAYQLPVRYFVAPAVAASGAGMVVPIGTWNAAWATALILVGVGLGLMVYWMAGFLKVRRTSIFIGGEKFSSEEVRVPAAGFYEGVREINPLAGIYRDAEAGAYDPYVLLGRYGSNIVQVLRRLHNGVLSTYVAFCVLGLCVLLFYLVKV